MGGALVRLHVRHEAKTVEIDQVRHRFEIVAELLPRHPPSQVVLASTLASSITLLTMSSSFVSTSIVTLLALVRAASQEFSSSAVLYSCRASDPKPLCELPVDACGAECGARSPVFVDPSAT